MEINITKTENFEVIPELFRGEDKPPKFIFRTPNTVDTLNILSTNDINKLLFDCFIGFENKIELKDDKGKLINYLSYEQFVSVGICTELMEIHLECVNAMADKVNSIKEKANKTAKKSK